MKKVLIVEDDSMLSEIYQKKFKSQDSFEVVSANSGTEAIKKAKEEKPDLVLLDLVLPEMDGFDVLEQIKKDPTLSNTKVVPFSNLSEEDNEKKLRELGADGFIAKSEHTPQELLEEVKKILKEDKGNSSEKPNVQNKEIDLSEDETVSDSTEEKQTTGKSVLIIEDEEVFLDVFSKELEKAGFYVDKALDGNKGADFLAKKSFDLVVLDISLKGIEAEQVIFEFKARKPKAKTKFVVLKSEDSSNKNLDQLKKLGVQGFIDRDKIDPKDFVAEIKAIA
jgi:DNA-binding response OmpR family regulator